MDSSYVLNPKLRLRFLRADRFDAPLAAVRFTKFFDKKLHLFGPDLLVREITQDDLNEEDMEALYGGMALDLPFRDRAGRLILFQLAQPVDVSLQAVLRKTLYGFALLSEEEETQKKGAVVISYLVGQQLTWQQMAQRQKMNREWGALLSSMPIRIEAMHLCADSIFWRPIFAVFKFAAGMFTRVRVREHMGDHKDVQFSLQTFGIPMADFPVAKDGTILRSICRDRWKKRKTLEMILKQAEMAKSLATTRKDVQQRVLVRVGTPGQHDVLLGRGKACYAHVGNIRLRNIVIERTHLYEGAGFAVKQKVSDEVVALIRSKGGRFLKDDGTGWVEVDDETARKKVSHAFRTFRGLKNNGGKFPKSGKRKKGDKPE